MVAQASDEPNREGVDPSQRDERYRAAIERESADDVHDVIAARGPEILDADLPYLIRSARNARLAGWRKGRRLQSFGLAGGDDVAAAEVDFDAAIDAADALELTLGLIAELSDRDALLLWRIAEGRSYDDVAAELVGSGLESSLPSLNALRKRRSRLLQQLRDGLRALGLP
jgi:hypothetical protein